MTADTLQQRAEFERLQTELSSRESITHFAKTLVSSIIAMLLSGAAAKLFIDSNRTPYLAWVATAAVTGLLIFATVHAIRGRRAHRSEATRFERLLELRRALRLDDPSALLPHG